MNFIGYAQSDISQLNEVIINDEKLSLNFKGLLSNEEYDYLDDKYSVEADRLLTQNEFDEYLEKVRSYYQKGIRKFRIKDLGLLEYLANNNEFKDIQVFLNLESGHHNLLSIKYYEKKYSHVLKRIIISTEITLENLKNIVQSIQTPVEIFGLGPILLFYSPRKLLGHQIKKELQQLGEDKKMFIASGTSTESPHSGFELIENEAGTLMYAPNHFCLLDCLDTLKDIGISNIRVDLRGVEKSIVNVIGDKFLCQLDSEKFRNFKELYPFRVLKGLFIVNKSKVLFKKLKNKRLENIQDHVGEIVEVVKDSHMVYFQESDDLLSIGDQVLIQSPDGKEKTVKLKRLTSLSGNNCTQAILGKHFIIDVVPAISIRSKISKI